MTVLDDLTAKLTLPLDPCTVCGQMHAEEVAMHFPIRGGGFWVLTEERYQQLNATYAGPRYQGVARVDLTDELAKIHGESLLAVTCERRWPSRRKGDR